MTIVIVLTVVSSPSMRLLFVRWSSSHQDGELINPPINVTPAV
jgi:hypothetical protein